VNELEQAGVVTRWSGDEGALEAPGEPRPVFVTAKNLVGVDCLEVGQLVRFTVRRLRSGRVVGEDVHVISPETDDTASFNVFFARRPR
jgi:hypothetical protein